MRAALLAFVALVACGKVEESSAAPSEAWRATSTKIEISSFGFWEGSSGYAKLRADMTPAQLTALDGLAIIATPQNVRTADNTSYRIFVTDADGSVVEYRAAAGNYVDGDEGDAAREKPTIDFHSLTPFLATFDCLSAKDIHYESRGTPQPKDPKSADLSKATKLPTDLGCRNSVYFPTDCSDSFLRLELTAGGTYAIDDARCIEQMTLRLYSSDGLTQLAESTPGPGNACFTLRYAFAPGSYLLQLTKTNASGCGPGQSGGAGDTTLAVTRLF